MSNPSLLERVEAATGADREIDAALFGQLLLRHFAPIPANGVPAFTASLDAALSLVERVLPGWDWSVHSHRHTEPSHRDAWAGVRAPPKGIVSGILYEANGYTPALALLAALLRATEEKPQP